MVERYRLRLRGGFDRSGAQVCERKPSAQTKRSTPRNTAEQTNKTSSTLMKPVQVFLRFEKLFNPADSMPRLVPPFRVAASFSSALSSSITSLSLEIS